MNKKGKQQACKGQQSITSFFQQKNSKQQPKKQYSPIKNSKQESKQQPENDTENNNLDKSTVLKEKTPLSQSDESQQSTTKNGVKSLNDSLEIKKQDAENTFGEETEQQEEVGNKRFRLKLNKNKKQQIKSQEKIIQQKKLNNSQIIESEFSILNENSNNNKILDLICENSNTNNNLSQQQQLNNDNVNDEEDIGDLFMESDNEDENNNIVDDIDGENKNQQNKQNSIKNNKKNKDFLQEEEDEFNEEDIYKKVMEMTDDEQEDEDNEEEEKLKKKKLNKNKKKNLDESYEFNEDNSNQNTDSGEEDFDDGSDFSSEVYTSRKNRRSSGGNKRRGLELNGEPQQRKQRKVILSQKQIEKIKYPYEVASTITLLTPGIICTKSGYHSKYNFFPIGYQCQREYQSTVNKGERTLYVSEILEGKKGKPLFQVTSEDNKQNPIKCESSSQCWKQIAEAAKKLNTGKSKVSISGPEMFGLQNQLIQQILENQPDADKCAQYYANQNKSSKSLEQDLEEEKELEQCSQ